MEDEEVKIDLRILERFRTSQSVRFENGVGMKLDYDIDMNEHLLRFEKDVWADRVADDQYSEMVSWVVPSSTWQYFKWAHEESWWLRWLVKRRPVRVNHHAVDVDVNVERFLKYPDLVLPENTFGRAAIYERVTVNKNVRSDNAVD